MSLLTDASIRACSGAGRLTLPGVLAALSRAEPLVFPALRPHQRQAWHALLVQLATIALSRAGLRDLPEDEAAWTDLLRALTPDWPGDEPWSLIVEDLEVPAFLQAPLPSGETLDGWKSLIESPDDLDMTVTAKNHDLKSSAVAVAEADDWLFALVSLQTQEGVMGAGKYGIARMNGGYGSRATFALVPPAGERFRREVGHLLDVRPKLLRDFEWMLEEGGLALTWLEPWDGSSPRSLWGLDPYFVEICRRVRLVREGGRLVARETGSKAARIHAKEQKGNLGDPWTPIARDEPRALSVTAEGFGYRRIVELLDLAKWERPPLSLAYPDDPEEGLMLLASAMARGQGKTEGLHERLIPLPNDAKWTFLSSEARDRLAEVSQRRVDDAGNLSRKALRPALFVLFQGGPDEVAWQRPSTDQQARPWLAAFDRRVDTAFFDDGEAELWSEVGAEPGSDAEDAARLAWLALLRDLGREILEAAEEAGPRTAMRYPRARARARRAFEGAWRRTFPSLATHEQDHGRDRDGAAAQD